VGQTPADHYKQSLRKQEYGVPDPESLRALTDRGGIAAPVGPAGTAVFFDCNTMHGSNSNITPYPRRNVFFVYNSVENRLQEPFCGLAPRPEHIASRVRAEALEFRPHA
jgi:ectoine hydroxylase